LARGGEFSLRSFLAGKIDLLQAEAVVAVVDARTPQELSQALDRMAGGVGRSVEELREYLLDLVADIEAAIDFADDLAPDAVPVPDTTQDAITPKIRHVCRQLDSVTHHLDGRDSGGQGGLPRVVLAGAPNIGKSSLFNHLVGRDAALVENAVGTTRDWIAGELYDTSGIVSCLLVDLAGIGGRSENGDCLMGEREVGVEADRVAWEEIKRADVIVACHDADAESAVAMAGRATIECIHVITRVDQQQAGKRTPKPQDHILTSVKSGVGIDQLRQRILEKVSSLNRATPATIRLRAGITSARESLVQAEKSMAGCDGLPPDEALLAVLLRHAIDALGEATGAVVGTDILDRVFSRHCIGK
jgi:tRNA modification GTPase